MSISMIGIDYNKASVDIRAHFSFTKKNAVETMERLKKEKGILGCVLLSTCNRMEIWISTKESWKGSLYEFLCREKNVDPLKLRGYFTERKDEEAVEHLFYLTSGLKSQILAEDQIITQVQDALTLSREAYCNSSLKAHKETARGTRLGMTIIYSHNFAGSHDGVRNRWALSVVSAPLEAEPNSQIS